MRKSKNRLYYKLLVYFVTHRSHNLFCLVGYALLRRMAILLGKLKIEITINLGKKEITIPMDNSAVSWHLSCPHMNYNLVRIATNVLKMFPDTTIVDVGANMGDTYAILRGSDVNAPLLLVEGDEHCVKYLRRNTQGDSQVTVWDGFVGLGGGDALHLSRSASTGHLLSRDHMTRTEKVTPKIRIDSLDTIIETTKMHNVSLLKSDTDGFDSLIVRSAVKTLQNTSATIFMETQPYHLLRNDDMKSFFKWTVSIGYTYYICWDNLGRYVCCLEGRQIEILQQLLGYFHGAPAFPFLDIALVHQNNALLAKNIVAEEIQYAAKNFKEFEPVTTKSIATLYA